MSKTASRFLLCVLALVTYIFGVWGIPLMCSQDGNFWLGVGVMHFCIIVCPLAMSLAFYLIDEAL